MQWRRLTTKTNPNHYHVIARANLAIFIDPKALEARAFIMTYLFKGTDISAIN